MSTLSKHTGNGNPTATGLQPKDTKEQIDGVLQQFDVLSSRFDRFLFKYYYIFLIGLIFLGVLLLIHPILSQPQAGKLLLVIGVSALPIVVIILTTWLFNVWRSRAPETLRELFEKRIEIPDGDGNKHYLCFLENYRDALGSPKRYFLSGSLIIICGSAGAYEIVQSLSVLHLNMFATILYIVGQLLTVLSYLGGIYFVGIGAWAMYISGRYVRNLVQAFELRIEPLHTDKCGGLKVLGNFCFGLVTPILIGSGLLIGYIFIYFISARNSGIDTVLLALVVGFALLLLLLYGFPVIVLAFIVPLRDIHTKMMSKRETDEDSYNARRESLRKEIQSLLDTNQFEEAKAVQEKRAILDNLPHSLSNMAFQFSFENLLGDPWGEWQSSHRNDYSSNTHNLVASIPHTIAQAYEGNRSLELRFILIPA